LANKLPELVASVAPPLLVVLAEVLLAALSRVPSSAPMSPPLDDVPLLDEDAVPLDPSRSARSLDESELDDADDVPPRELTRLSSNAERLLLMPLSEIGAMPLSGGGGGGDTPPTAATVPAALDDDAETAPTCWACSSADCVAALSF